MLKSSELHRLGEYFNLEDLPEEFGGTCRCENGCLPPIPKHMVSFQICIIIRWFSKISACGFH